MRLGKEQLPGELKKYWEQWAEQLLENKHAWETFKYWIAWDKALFEHPKKFSGVSQV